MLFCSC